MQKIAVTSSIAGGKSTVLKFFKQLGLATIDCDAIVRQLYTKKSIQKKLLKEFGTCKKELLAQKIFSNKRERKKLEKKMHPLVLKEMKKKLVEFKKKRKKIVVIDVPLLFEAKLFPLFDLVIVVKAKKKQLIERMQKKGLSKREAEQRLKAFLPLREKIKKADFIIDNTGSLQETKKQVKKILGAIK